MEEESEKGHHDRTCPIIHSKSSEEQKKKKKMSSRPQMSYVPLHAGHAKEWNGRRILVWNMLRMEWKI